jgi:hypothetical protein
LEVSGQLHAPAALPPGKSPRYPFYRRLGGPQSRSGRYGELKIFHPPGTRTPTPHGRPARSQSLYRMSYPGSLNSTGRPLTTKFRINKSPANRSAYLHAVQDYIPLYSVDASVGKQCA